MNTKKLNDFAKKQPIALGCAFLSIVLAVVIYYRADGLPDAEAQLAAKTAEWEHIRDNVKNSEQLSEQFATLTQATQAVESRLVHADQLAINLQYFYRLEAETQTKLTDLRQTGLVDYTKSQERKGLQKKGLFPSIGYAVVVQGPYERLMNFLRRIENSEHFARVDSLTLASAGGGETNAGGGANNTRATDLSLRLDIELLGMP